MYRSTSQRSAISAFSLIELSIVLVILGLLTGGILSGQSLIRASELRAVTTEYQRYVTAVQSFRDKYLATPGDFSNAHSFWGYENAAVANCSAVYAGTTARSGTCDGDGDGVIESGAAVSTTAEAFQFWKQLALAGLVEGSYTGFAGPTAGTTGLDTVPAINAPRSRMSNSLWGVSNFSGGDAWRYNIIYGNFFVFGNVGTGSLPEIANLKPEEAWNIDTKLDDGKPGTGKVIARFWSSCANSATASDFTGTYTLTGTTALCSLYFINAF